MGGLAAFRAIFRMPHFISSLKTSGKVPELYFFGTGTINATNHPVDLLSDGVLISD